MKASDYIVSFLHSQGTNVVFGYIGGMITHLVDSLGQSKDVKYIQTYHEQTASIAAEGYAIGTGKLGCAISTSGPGATNMMTGIADAYFDSIPVLYITGQVNSYEFKYDKPIRQQGFQETDVVDIVKPITKYTALVDKAENLRYELEKAAYIAMHERKGPVLLDITMDVQRTEIDPLSLKAFIPENNKTYSNENLDIAIDTFSHAKRPIALIGGGCINNKIKKILESFLTDNKIPVITSLMGRGAVDETYDYYVGMVGSYGNRCANIVISQADVLLVLGSRLDTRQTGAKIDTFLTNGKIVHVDIDSNELKYHRIKNQVHVNMPVAEFLSNINKTNFCIRPEQKWLDYVINTKDKYNQDQEIARFVENKAPYKFIQALNEITKEGDILTTDVGQNQMWAAQTIKLKKNMRYLTSGGLAPMGYSMPAAIGISFANIDQTSTIYCLCGDGGFHMSTQSLGVIAQYHLPIKVIVLNNSTLGMITQFQHLYFDDRMTGTTSKSGYIVPDIQNLASAYSLRYSLITEDDLKDIDHFESIIKSSDLIEYKINGLTTVCPKLEYNKPIEKPIPLLPEKEQKSAMFNS